MKAKSRYTIIGCERTDKFAKPHAICLDTFETYFNRERIEFDSEAVGKAVMYVSELWHACVASCGTVLVWVRRSDLGADCLQRFKDLLEPKTRGANEGTLIRLKMYSGGKKTVPIRQSAPKSDLLTQTRTLIKVPSLAPRVLGSSRSLNRCVINYCDPCITTPGPILGLRALMANWRENDAHG
jgi:hypothetical protein